LDTETAEALAEQEGYFGTLELSGLTHIAADAAVALGRHRGGWLALNGVTSLDDAAAAGLGSYSGRLLGLGSLRSLNASTAKSLARFGGDVFLHGLTGICDEAADQLRSKTTGRISFVNRETDPFPPCSDEAILLLYSSPAISLPSDVLNRVEALLKQLAARTILDKSLQRTVKACLSSADESDINRAAEALKPFHASDGDMMAVLSAAACKKLVKTCNPSIWKALAGLCSVGPCAQGRFLRAVADLCKATSNKSSYLTNLRDMFGEFCGLTADAHPLLLRAVKVFVDRASESRPTGNLSVCHDGALGFLPATRQSPALSADMADALSPGLTGLTLSLRVNSLSDEAANILAKSKINTLILHGLERVSPAAAKSLAAFPGYLKLTSDSLPEDVRVAVVAGREHVRDGYYKAAGTYLS
jgi:hypothetical protein